MNDAPIPLTTIAGQSELTSWVERVTGGRIVGARRIVGGNRRQAWALDLAGGSAPAGLFLRFATTDEDQGADPYTLDREAGLYQALAGTGVCLPRFVARHASRSAFLMQRVEGQSRYVDAAPRPVLHAVADDVMRKLAALHRVDAASLELPGFARAPDIAGQVRSELAIWRGMYLETGVADLLIDFALDWLECHVPDAREAPVLVHGDAGPGNFLHRDGAVTALIDWELAHLGDPMEDLAWLSMRTVLEPFPDFPAHIGVYAAACGRPIDRPRLMYHRVFVPLRVVVIRHRGSLAAVPDGDLANSLISRALNRRLLVEALAAAMGVALPPPPEVEAPASPLQADYAYVLGLLRSRIAPDVGGASAAAAVKSVARMVKYLAANERFGDAVRTARMLDLAAVAGGAPAGLRACDVPSATMLQFLARDTARDTVLAAPAMGALASRPMPNFE